jgi:hypothetical protein
VRDFVPAMQRSAEAMGKLMHAELLSN